MITFSEFIQDDKFQGMCDATETEAVKNRFMREHGDELYDAIAQIVTHNDKSAVEYLASRIEAIAKWYVADMGEP